MFCNEEIENVYLGQPNHDRNGDLFLDCYHDMALHLSDSYRIVLETASFYITIETSGVSICNKKGDIETIAKYDEWLECLCHIDEDDPEDEPWKEYEYTLFTGETIKSIEEHGKTYIIHFKDFALTVIPYSDGEDVPRFCPAPYSKVLGAERLIKKCSCGGTGILVIDFVNDYGIRCEKCHKGTCASMCACDAIDEWNCSEELPIIGDYPQEEFIKYRSKIINYIAIRNRFKEHLHFPFACESIVTEIADKIFCIESCYIGQGRFGFSIEEFSGFNHEFWPNIIETQIGDIRLESESDFDKEKNKQLIFNVGGKRLRVKSNKGKLLIENPECIEVHSWEEK